MRCVGMREQDVEEIKMGVSVCPELWSNPTAKKDICYVPLCYCWQLLEVCSHMWQRLCHQVLIPDSNSLSLTQIRWSLNILWNFSGGVVYVHKCCLGHFPEHFLLAPFIGVIVMSCLLLLLHPHATECSGNVPVGVNASLTLIISSCPRHLWLLLPRHTVCERKTPEKVRTQISKHFSGLKTAIKRHMYKCTEEQAWTWCERGNLIVSYNSRDEIPVGFTPQTHLASSLLISCLSSSL